MQKFSIPGAFWAALIVAVVPAVQTVIMQFWPEASYIWSAAIVAGLTAIAKAAQMALAPPPPAPPPGVAATPEPLPARPWWLELLFG